MSLPSSDCPYGRIHYQLATDRNNQDHVDADIHPDRGVPLTDTPPSIPNDRHRGSVFRNAATGAPVEVELPFQHSRR
jgi:hypothetical protein